MGLLGVNEWVLLLDKMANTCGEGDCGQGLSWYRMGLVIE